MSKHPFVAGTVTIRRGSAPRSFCQTCGKPGAQRSTSRSGRPVTYWQHDGRTEVQPAPREECSWGAAGGLWCCKPIAHTGGHHAHRGPRRDVGH